MHGRRIDPRLGAGTEPLASAGAPAYDLRIMHNYEFITKQPARPGRSDA